MTQILLAVLLLGLSIAQVHATKHVTIEDRKHPCRREERVGPLQIEPIARAIALTNVQSISTVTLLVDRPELHGGCGGTRSVTVTVETVLVDTTPTQPPRGDENARTVDAGLLQLNRIWHVVLTVEGNHASISSTVRTFVHTNMPNEAAPLPVRAIPGMMLELLDLVVSKGLFEKDRESLDVLIKILQHSH